MRPSNSVVFNATVGSAGATISSAVMAIDIIRASFQVSVSSGSFVGTFQVQASNDIPQGLPPNLFTPTNWSTITSASVVASVSLTARSFMILPIETSYNYMRVAFTDASGGTANGVPVVTMNAKGL